MVVSLTVRWVPHGVRLGVIVHTVYELGANGGAVVLHGFDLRRPGRGVCPEDGLAVLVTVGVMARIAAAHGAHCAEEGTQKRGRPELM